MALDDVLTFQTQNLPEPQRSTITAALTQLVLMKLVERLYKELGEDHQRALETLVDSPDSDQEVFEFLKQKFPDIEERAKKVAQEEKEELDIKMKELLTLVKNNLFQ